jgi:integrase
MRGTSALYLQPMGRRKPQLGSIYLRGEIYWVKYYHSGRPYRESSHSREYQEAEHLLKRRQGEIVSGKFGGIAVERIRMAELFEDLVEDYRINKRSSLTQLQSRLSNHLRPAFAFIRAADLSTNHVKRYTAARLEAGAANATVNRELEILERALRLGTQCDPPKVLRVIHIATLQEDNVRTGFLEDDGYIRLRNELPDYLKPLLVVGYHVGNRLGELLRLRWVQVDFTNGQIRLSPGTTKNKKGRTLPIYGHMREYLLMQKAVRDAEHPTCDLVFHHEGEPIVDFRKAWASACVRAGCSGLLFHDLRRSAVRNMRLSGLEESVAMRISGHRTRAIFDRYDIVGPRDINEAGAKMERRLTRSLGTISGTTQKSKPGDTKAVADQTATRLLN